MLFRKKKVKDRKRSAIKTKIIRGGTHGTHISAAITDDFDMLQEWILENLTKREHPFALTEQKFADVGVTEVQGNMLEINERLSLIVILAKIKGKWEIATAYPFIWDTPRVRCKIEGVYQWINAVEANIEINVNEKASVTYFATDYFIEKPKYLNGGIKDVSLWIVGYNLYVNPFKGKRISVDNNKLPFKEVSLENAEIFLPLSKSPALDDYYVTGRVRDISKINVFNKEFYVVRIGSEAIGGEMDILIAKENMEREPIIGDLVGVSGWLEGAHFVDRWSKHIEGIQ